MRDREQLIESLVGDLTAKPRQLPVLWMALIWWLLSWIYVSVATLLMGELRPTAIHEITHDHQFQIESLIGLIASFLIAVAAWYGSTPGALTKKLMTIGCGFALVWVSLYGFYVAEMLEPALTPSMHGKREHCYYDAFIYSFPPTLVACVLIAKRYPLKKYQTGFLVGLAAGMMPALFMQFACMYDPVHILIAHIFPGFLNGVIGLLVFLLVYRFVKKGTTDS